MGNCSKFKITMKNSVTLGLFGSYDKNYTSNKLIETGLIENNVRLIEFNSSIPVTRLDQKNEMNWMNLITRVIRKYKVYIEVIKNRKKLTEVDAIYVGYPGHFDVLMAYPIAKLFRKKLIFNPLLIFFTGFFIWQEYGFFRKKI